MPLLLVFPAIAALSQSAAIQISLGDKVEDCVVFASYIVSMLGLAIRWITIGYAAPGTSGRNTHEQRADTLNTDGMYSIVKNPLYFGNFLAFLGMLMAIKVWWFILIGGLVYWIYIERVIAIEERYLAEKFGETYASWSARTPIFIPNPRLWQRPHLAFSFRKVLRQEYYGIAVVGSFFFLSDMAMDLIIEGEPLVPWMKDDWYWIVEFIISISLFILLTTMRKTGHLQDKPQGTV